MTAEALKRIGRMIERVSDAVASERNRARGKARPTAFFQVEEPIAWTHPGLFGYDVNRYFTDPVFYFEQALRQKLWRWDNFPDDDLPMTLDIPAWLGHYPEYTFVGMEVAFNRRGVPRIQTDHPLSREADLRLLRPVDFAASGWMPRVRRWYDDLEKISAGRMNVTFNMTWWRGCLDLAIQLRGYENFVQDTVERPGFVHDLLAFLTEQRCRWYEAYYRHYGLKTAPVYIADDWINIPFITPQMFADFVLPRYLDIEKFHGGITGVHSCGNQTPVQKYLLEIKSIPTLEVSPWTDAQETLRNVPADKFLSIALHPNDVLLATPDEMREKLRYITGLFKTRKYGIATSGLTPTSDDIARYVNQIRTWTAVAREVLQQVRAESTDAVV